MAEASRPERPVFVIRPSEPVSFRPRGGGSVKTTRPTRARQGERLAPRFDELQRLLEGSASAVATDGFPGGDPELVLVFEVVDASLDLEKAFRKAGLEPLLDIDDEYSADSEDFKPLSNDDGSIKTASLFVHASMANEAAVRQVLVLWADFVADRPLPRGLTPFRDLFACLKDVRIWGPLDRVRNTGLDQLIDEALANGQEAVPIQIELWYKPTQETRLVAEQAIRSILDECGATDLSVAEHSAISYHAIAATMPVAELDAVRSSDALLTATDLALLRSPSVLFVRPGGQRTGTDLEDGLPIAEPGLPAGVTDAPLIALLDGLPATNHPLLRNRLVVLDPDDFSGDPTYTVDRRVHGTMVASAIVRGDMSRNEAPLSRPIMVRPILKPDLKTQHAEEGVPWNVLAPDTTIRAVRDICSSVEGKGVRIFNLSVGDPLGQFDTIPSAWARALDWLAFEHNILFVVSAGNHRAPLPIDPALLRNGSPNKNALVAGVLATEARTRRLLSPAESMNALTVGSVHADGAGDGHELGYRIDLWDGDDNVSPVSASGRGTRRSIKPDVSTAGGRLLYDDRIGHKEVQPARGRRLPPGVLVAAPPDRQAYDSGTTFAAAEVTRRAGRIAALLLEQSNIDDQYVSVATKALIVHGAERGRSPFNPAEADRFVGYGLLRRDMADGCLATQATALFVADLKASQKVTLELPLPADVATLADVRRVTTTLAWLSPINWGHRQYRRAKLTLDGPSEIASDHRSYIGMPDRNLMRRGTVEHRSFETKRAYAAEQLTFTISCAGQAGGFDGPVRFAVAVTLEVGPGIAIPVYDLVRQQIQARIRNK